VRGKKMRVFVYYNLHKHLWSVKALEGPYKGRVIIHAKRLDLETCTFKVSKKGRERVIREGRKNVHAGVVGSICYNDLVRSPEYELVTYNPYKYETFVKKSDEKPIHKANKVIMLAYGKPEVLVKE
jgi:hypothetical protein